MPQRISDEILAKAIEFQDEPEVQMLLLDLRDAREQLKTLKTYGEAKFAELDRLKIELDERSKRTTLLFKSLGDCTRRLKLAIEGLELVADQNDALYPKQVAQTYLDRIKGITDATTNK